MIDLKLQQNSNFIYLNIKNNLILKTIVLSQRLIFKLLAIDNNKDDRYGIIDNNKKIARKLEKSKSKKLFKSQKLAKLEKKLLKSENSLNYDAKEIKLNFLSFDTRKTFNCLLLAFIKVSIL